jgi:hypothetical protein
VQRLISKDDFFKVREQRKSSRVGIELSMTSVGLFSPKHFSKQGKQPNLMTTKTP